jgi:ankyrin repeat protein
LDPASNEERDRGLTAKRRRKRFFLLLEIVTVVCAVASIALYANFLATLAGISYHFGRYGVADTLLKQDLWVQEKAFGPKNPALTETLNAMAYIYYDRDQIDKAVQVAERSLAICQASLGPNDPRRAWTLSMTSLVYDGSGNFAGAERMAREALPVLEAAYGQQSFEVASTLNRLGLALDGEGRLPEAEASLKRALAIREARMGPNWDGLLPILDNLTRVYSEEGREQEAAASHQRAEDIAAHNGVQPTAAPKVNAAPKDLDNELMQTLKGCRGHVDVELVHGLLQQGASPNAADTDSDSFTALIAASNKGYPGIVELLLDSGAEVNTRAKILVKDDGYVLDGFTALSAAAFGGNASVARTLIARGADVHAVDSRGASLMLWARSNEVVQVFLDQGLDINARDIDGATLLLLSTMASASANPHEFAARSAPGRGIPDVAFLLQHGADPNAKAKNGLTPLKASQGRPELVELLKKAGAKK